MILNGTTTVPTSTFPYTSIGPVDFSHENFVRTEQTDYYYGSVSGTLELLSAVKQTSDPAISILEIAGIMLAFFLILGYGIMKIRKMGK